MSIYNFLHQSALSGPLIPEMAPNMAWLNDVDICQKVLVNLVQSFNSENTPNK